ncbi:MAG TPA: shikimate dehydrogenase, partial [Terrimesophilobacter sp.]|nr:shikimate dehydrogenase [Terrimesophilobacter sp.]
MAEDRNRLAVLGSPIAHSKSPAIHLAAYRVLGLDWSYDAVEVASGDLGAFLNGCGSSWRGLSLTMPLKREIVPYLAEQDAVSRLVGAVNTVLVTEDGFAGFNTDVVGAERM